MKIVVETTGKFQILGRGAGNLVPHHRPKVVAAGSFSSYQARGMLRMVGQVSDNVTDDDLVAWLKEGKSVEDFIKANSPNAPETPVDDKPRRGSRKG